MVKNKREHTRFIVFLESLTCKKSGSSQTELQVYDVSSNGMGLVSPGERLIKGEKIDFELLFPKDDIPMFITGEVAWVRKDPKVQDAYRVGIKFFKIHHYDKDRLINYIHSAFIKRK